MQSPIDTFRFVMERSGEIRHRMDSLDRDIAAAVRRMAGDRNPLTDVKRFAFHGIGYMDRVVVIPTWIGAYNKALAAGSTRKRRSMPPTRRFASRRARAARRISRQSRAAPANGGRRSS
jgi:hypothetical protein